MQDRLEWLENNGYVQDGKIVHTRTTKFLMPLIGISEYSIGYIHPKIFINAHVKNYNEKYIYVILDKKNYFEQCKEYIVLQNLNEHYKDLYSNDFEYVLVYEIPKHFHEDFDKILNGKYSKTNGYYKDIICKIYGAGRFYDDHRPSIYDCLEPTDQKRKLYADFLGVDKKEIKEVSSIPNEQYEIYKDIFELNNITKETINYGESQ
jgi:hypothetical protein